jgi:1-deoxy-D-xylulose-5-phosphate reductoisomerase
VIGVSILGSTGTIGENTLDVVARNPDHFRVVALGARSSWERLAEQCERWRPAYAALASPDAAGQLERALRERGVATRVLAGDAGIEAIAGLPEAPYVMAGIVGSAGLRSTLAAARAGQRLLIANKESLVMAGPLLLAEARSAGATLLPIDSEHNAVFQCLPSGAVPGLPPTGVRRVILTASGGPFLDWPAERIENASPAQACAHPKWVMGRKISVDSATLMNKGLEVIEASILFGLGVDRVDVVVHRQSIIHSMVEYVDGSVLAQLGSPDMRTPIAHAMAWPERAPSGVQFLDLVKVGQLQFEEPDLVRFPCLALAREAARQGGLAPAIANAANEVAVAAFLEGRLNFGGIPRVIAEVLGELPGGPAADLEAVIAADAAARRSACRIVERAEGIRC